MFARSGDPPPTVAVSAERHRSPVTPPAVAVGGVVGWLAGVVAVAVLLLGVGWLAERPSDLADRNKWSQLTFSPWPPG